MDPQPDWVPADACVLPTDEQPARLAEFDDVFAAHLRDVRRAGARHLVLGFAGDDGVLATVTDLAAREAACCAFFDFAAGEVDGVVRLDVRVPPERVVVLDGVEGQARSALQPVSSDT